MARFGHAAMVTTPERDAAVAFARRSDAGALRSDVRYRFDIDMGKG